MASQFASQSRLIFVDHLRAALIILVVLHHLAVIYGANTSFYYLEPAYGDVLALVVLVIFGDARDSSGAIAQVRTGSDRRGSTLLRGCLPGPKDSARGQGPLNMSDVDRVSRHRFV